jgi:hypothetical protein
MAREGGELGAERAAEDDPVVVQRSAVSSCGASWGRGRTRPPTPMTVTFLPGPAPPRTRPESVVRPAQSIDAAVSDGSTSGLEKT